MEQTEIKLEILKMARDILVEEFALETTKAEGRFAAEVKAGRMKEEDRMGFLPQYPSSQKILTKAQELSSFVSQGFNVPHNPGVVM
jgi:hypothetical protein